MAALRTYGAALVLAVAAFAATVLLLPRPLDSTVAEAVGGFAFLGPAAIVFLRVPLAASAVPAARACGHLLVAVAGAVLLVDAARVPSSVAHLLSGGVEHGSFVLRANLVILALVAASVGYGWLRTPAGARGIVLGLTVGLTLAGAASDVPIVLALVVAQAGGVLLLLAETVGWTDVRRVGALAGAGVAILAVLVALSGIRGPPVRVVLPDTAVLAFLVAAGALLGLAGASLLARRA